MVLAHLFLLLFLLLSWFLLSFILKTGKINAVHWSEYPSVDYDHIKAEPVAFFCLQSYLSESCAKAGFDLVFVQRFDLGNMCGAALSEKPLGQNELAFF